MCEGEGEGMEQTDTSPMAVTDSADKTERTYTFHTDSLSTDGKGVETINGSHPPDTNHPGDKTESKLQEVEIRRKKFSITKSQWAVNMAFFLAWTSIAGLTIIQSSVIGLEGTIGLSLNFAFSIFGATLVAPLCLRFIGCKKSMIVGLSTVLIYEASNFYPHWGTIVPASIISGLGIGPMFAAQGTYLTQQAINYGVLNGEEDEAVIGRFFGLFFCVFLSCK